MPNTSSAPFQDRVQPWLQECFGKAIAANAQERNHRFLEAGHDPDCIEWANIQVLDQNLQPTGEWEHHVPECQLDDPA